MHLEYQIEYEKDALHYRVEFTEVFFLHSFCTD